MGRRRAQNKTISENDILAFAPIAAKLDDFVFDVKVRPKGFTLLIRNKGQWSELKIWKSSTYTRYEKYSTKSQKR